MQCVFEIESDILRQEFGTYGNTLSFWKCNDINDTIDAIKAILLSTSAIDDSRFIIIDQSIVSRYGLTMDDKVIGTTGYRGFENLHIDMTCLTYGKMGTVIKMLHEVVTDEQYTPIYRKDEIELFIKEVIDCPATR